MSIQMGYSRTWAHNIRTKYHDLSFRVYVDSELGNRMTIIATLSNVYSPLMPTSVTWNFDGYFFSPFSSTSKRPVEDAIEAIRSSIGDYTIDTYIKLRVAIEHGAAKMVT